MKIKRVLSVFVALVMFFSFYYPHPIEAKAAPVGNITSFTAANRFTFDIVSRSAKIKVVFYTDDIFRIRLANSKGQFDDPASAKSTPIIENIDFPAINVAWSDEGTYYKMETATCVLRAYKTPLTFAMYKKDNTTLIWQEAAPLSNDGTATTQSLARRENENFYGCGMQNGYFSHRDRSVKIELYIPDGSWDAGSVSNPAPFYMSTAGYGAFRNTFSKGQYNFYSTTTLKHNETRFDCFYFNGPSLGDILNRYTQVTGRPALPPQWGLGAGYANCFKNTPDVVPQIADPWRAKDLPGSWILPNDGYGCGYTNLPTAVSDLRDKGFNTGLWTSTGLNPSYEVGSGSRMYKLDVGWVGPGYDFALDCARQAYQGTENYSDERGYVLSCCGWAGTQRYSAIWSGDQYGSWEYIRFHIPTLVGAGLSGFPFAGSDIDGIFGGSAKTHMRDIQYKIFTSLYYYMDGWAGSIRKYPWNFGEPYTSYTRDYLKLAMRLRPYMYSYASEAYETGAPIVRGMVFEFPDDPKTWGTDTQYQFMSGKWFLVAPVYEDTTARNNIYLPAGKWVDYWDGTVHNGGKTLNNYYAPVEKLPLLVREGAIIPMYHEENFDIQRTRDTLTLDLYPSGSTSFTLYEDDGTSREYRTGAYAKIVITSVAPSEGIGDATITVGESAGSYAGKPIERKNILQIHSKTAPGSVTLNSFAMTELASKAAWDSAASGWFYDASDRGGIIYIKTGSLPTGIPFTVTAANYSFGEGSTVDPDLIPKAQITATASSQQSGDDAINAVDDDIATIWHTKWDLSNPLPQSITLNLNGMYNVDRIKYLPRQDSGTNGIITGYKIYVSSDGINFVEVKQGTWANDKTEKEAVFGPYYISAVRLEATEGVGGYASAAEIGVYKSISPTQDPYIVPNSQITAEATSYQPGHEPSKAVDNDTLSIWHTQWTPSVPALPQSITLNLGGIYSISRVNYLPRQDSDGGNGTITSYRIYTSTDGTNFTEVASGSWDSNKAEKSAEFAAVNASHVRLEAIASVGGFASAAEVKILKAGYQNQAIPPVPADLAASALSASNISVSWNSSAGATGYDLEADGTIISNAASPYIHSGLQENTTHVYRVRAKNSSGSSTWSTAVSGTTQQLAPPNQPSGLTATAASSSQIEVSWINGDRATSHDLEIDGVIVANVTNPFTRHY